MTTTKQAFYCNRPCTILADLGDELVIELFTHEVEIDPGNGYDEPPYSEPIHSKILAKKAYVTDKPVILEEQFAEMQRACTKMKADAELEMSQQKWQIQREIDELRKKMLARVKKYSGLETMLDFLEGEVKWVFIEDTWSLSILTIEDALKSDDRRVDDRLRAICFNSREVASHRGEVEMLLNAYSDGSGNWRKIRGFRTQEEAVEFAKGFVKAIGKNLSHRVVDFCDKWGITLPEVEEYRELSRKRAEDQRQADIQKAERELERLKSGSSPSPKLPGANYGQRN